MSPDAGRAKNGFARAVRVQVFLSQTDRDRQAASYMRIVEYLRREGAAGVTVIRGFAGFGASGRVSTASFVDVEQHLPVVVVWVDAPERVERLLPGVRERAGSGLVALDEVEIASYGGRGLDQLRFDLHVEDVMRTEVVSVRAEAPLREAVELLIGQEFRALPVVDEARRLRGILANADLLARGGLTARLELLSAMPAEPREAVLAALPVVTVAEVMHGDVAVLQPRETLESATRRMSELRLKRLPVVDEEGRLVGILSRADVLRAVAESFPREPADGSHAGARTAGELMRSDAPVVLATAPLAQVVTAVASTRLNRAVVVDEDRRVVGVVADADVLRSVGFGARPGVLSALMRAGGRTHGTVTAGDVVQHDAPVVTADTLLADAAQVMVARRRKILPVVDADGRLLGILDRADLLHAASNALASIAQAGAGGPEGSGDARDRG
jgi:CBS-domain-containing membrane protein